MVIKLMTRTRLQNGPGQKKKKFELSIWLDGPSISNKTTIENRFLFCRNWQKFSCFKHNTLYIITFFEYPRQILNNFHAA